MSDIDAQPLPPPDVQRWAPSIEAYATWLEREDFAAARRWASALRDGASEHVEAAIGEAVAWDWLSNRVDSIELALVPDAKSPDFRCQWNRDVFFVEVSNLSRHAMTEACGMPDHGLFSGFRGSPAVRLHREILNNSEKGLGLGSPYLVFVTTLHWNGSVLLTDRLELASVLHSREFIQGTYDPERGEVVGNLRNVTDFRRAAFTQTRSTRSMRNQVAGALFGPFGFYPDGVDVHGILNPEATHQFDPAILPDVPFARFAVWPPDPHVVIEWSDGRE